MNENIDLTKILKDCPEDTKFYCSICGEVIIKIKTNYTHPIHVYQKAIYAENPRVICRLSSFGKYNKDLDGECVLFPSKDQRDWSKFTAPWYKKEKFDPKTLQPFDKILVKRYDDIWMATLLSYYNGTIFTTINNGLYESCIPYNEDTKHLVGTTEEAPEYYRYWE